MPSCSRIHRTRLGTRIAYEVRGNEGPSRKGDVLFFNGLFSGMSSWRAAYRNRALCAEYRLVFFDYVCQGASQVRFEPFHARDIVADCRDFALALALSRAVFVGHSFGGMVATMLSGGGNGVEPLEPKGLMVVNSGLKLPRSSEMMFEALRLYFNGSRGFVQHDGAGTRSCPASESFRFLIPHLFGDPFLDRARRVEAEILASYEAYNANAPAVAALLDACIRRGAELGQIGDYMLNVAQPVKVISGALDRVFPPELGAQLANFARRGEHEILDEAGHSCMIECPDVFSLQLQRFIASTDLPRERSVA